MGIKKGDQILKQKYLNFEEEEPVRSVSIS